MAVLSSPVAHVRDLLPAQGQYERMYWHYDAIADSWDLTADRSQENGRLADVDGDGFFDLALDPIYPTVAATLAAARRGGTDILIY